MVWSIIVQLIDVESDTHIWAEEYNLDFDELLSIQTELSHKVAISINDRIDETEIHQLDVPFYNDLGAYNNYLKARHFFWVEVLDVSLNAASSTNENKSQSFALTFIDFIANRIYTSERTK